MSNRLFSRTFLDALSTYNRVAVGFSGGLDSLVLLHALSAIPSLHARLIAIHVNHGLSPDADAWQAHCEKVCEGLKVTCYVSAVKCTPQEASARTARYQAFDEFLTEQDALVLAHHEQDQAETVLLQLCRGTGIDGLCGMHAERKHGIYTLFRPWLELSRDVLISYAKAHHLLWVEDESNDNVKYARNRIRHQVLPHLKERWPQVNLRLSKLAQHAKQVQSNLDDLALIDCPVLSEKRDNLFLTDLKSLSRDRISNVLWCWLKQQEIKPLNQGRVERLLNELVYPKQASGLKNEFSNGAVWRYQQTLYWVKLNAHFPVNHAFRTLLTSPTSRGLSAGSRNLSPSLDPADKPRDVELEITCADPLKCETRINISFNDLSFPEGSQIEVRYRQGGETFYWHGQTKSLKKLLQAWKVPPWLRDKIPLVYVNGELGMVMGYAISEKFI